MMAAGTTTTCVVARRHTTTTIMSLAMTSPALITTMTTTTMEISLKEINIRAGCIVHAPCTVQSPSVGHDNITSAARLEAATEQVLKFGFLSRLLSYVNAI